MADAITTSQEIPLAPIFMFGRATQDELTGAESAPRILGSHPRLDSRGVSRIKAILRDRYGTDRGALQERQSAQRVPSLRIAGPPRGTWARPMATPFGCPAACPARNVGVNAGRLL